MALLDKITQLEEQMNQYLELHDNPYDTSMYDAVAERLRKLLPALHKAINKTKNTSTDSNAKTIGASVGVGGSNQDGDVRIVQTLLEITVDGDCGPKTKKAIKDFQRKHDIKPVSGLVDVDSPTWNKLSGNSSNDDNSTGGDNSTGDNNNSDNNDNSTGSSQSITGSVGVRGDNQDGDVRTVQTLLEVVVDGDCGPKTKKAIKDFQRKNDIKPVSGLIEPNSETWNKLVGSSSNNDIDTGGDDSTGDNTGDQDGTGDDNQTPVTDHCIKKSVGKDGKNDNHDVRVIETMLNSNGYELAVNGIADDELTNTIKDFQRRKQQNPTGLIEPDDDTFLLLDGKTPTRDTSLPNIDINDTLQKSVGDGGKNETADVALVQKLLRDDWGYNIPVDGDPQDSTIQAIRQFQHRFAGMISSQDGRVDPGGKTIKYLTGVLKPTEGYTEDGIIGGVETEMEKKMADFTKAFSGVRVEVNPGEWVVVRPPYHINLGKRKNNAATARSKNSKVNKIVKSIGLQGRIGKATIAQIEDFLNQCIAGKLIPDNQKNSEGLNKFLAKYGISTDCSGLAIQAANFLLQDDLERNKHNQDSEDVKITNTGGIQNESGRKDIPNPVNLRAGDMMVNYKRNGTGTYHVRIVVDVDVHDDHVAFTTVESGSDPTLGADGAGHGVGQRRWKCPNKTDYKNLQILLGNNWQKAERSDQNYTYVRMRQTKHLQDSE